MNNYLIAKGKGPWITLGKKKVLNFSCGDILGITYTEEFAEAIHTCLERYDILDYYYYGQTENGNQTDMSLIQEIYNLKGLENIKIFTNTTSALIEIITNLFKSGYNILVDEYFDNPIISSLRGWENKITFFQHNSINELQKIVESHQETNFAILVQSLYPISSEYLKINDLISFLDGKNIPVIIYESLADGLVGERGEGIRGLYKDLPETTVLVGGYYHLIPFSISYAAYTKKAWNLLGQCAEGIIQRTLPSSFSKQMTLWLIQFIQGNSTLLKRLSDNANYLRYELQDAGFKVLGDFSPVIPILIPEREKVIKLTNLLIENNVKVVSLYYATIPLGKSRVLIYPSALHIKQDLDFGIERLKEVAESLDII